MSHFGHEWDQMSVWFTDIEHPSSNGFDHGQLSGKQGTPWAKKMLQILMESMPRHVRTVAAARGCHTWYWWYRDMLSDIANPRFGVSTNFTAVRFDTACHWSSSSHDYTETWVSTLVSMKNDSLQRKSKCKGKSSFTFWQNSPIYSLLFIALENI